MPLGARRRKPLPREGLEGTRGTVPLAAPVGSWRDGPLLLDRPQAEACHRLAHGCCLPVLVSRGQDLLEPEHGGFTFLPGHLVHGAAVSNAVPEFGELVEALDEEFLVPEPAVEHRFQPLARDRGLQLTKVRVY